MNTLMMFMPTTMQYNSDKKKVDTAVGTSSTNTELEPQRYRWKILWLNVLTFVILHSIVFYGIYIILCGRVQFKTLICALVVYCCNGMGVTAGAHRLWAHRTYKARMPLRVLLAAFQTMSYQYSIFKWVSDHRVHHMYTDTDADPYNSTRGFFFSHIGWLLVHKHPVADSKCRSVDMSDVLADPVVAWQKKHYAWLGPLMTFFIPPVIPYFFWNENFFYSFVVVGVFRYMLALHATFLVNSAAHAWGTKPYDKNITPAENPSVSLLTFGEGWHNYHHAFPWDYKAAELGNYRLNLATAFIDTCAYLGLAYDLKTADPVLVSKRSKRTGDVLR